MKKTLLTIAVTVLAFAMVGCGNKENNDKVTSTPAPSATEAPADNNDSTPAPEVTDAPSETDKPSADKSYGEVLAEAFRKEVANSKDVVAIGDKLSEVGIAYELNCMGIDVEEGFLTGFTDEIHGFTKGYRFSPMIGAIPFVAYVFETSDAAAAETLKATLLNLADQRWNICTSAAETVVDVYENIVFFTMTPDPVEMEM